MALLVPDPITAALDGIWAESEQFAAIEHPDRAVRIQEYVVAIKNARKR